MEAHCQLARVVLEGMGWDSGLDGTNAAQALQRVDHLAFLAAQRQALRLCAGCSVAFHLIRKLRATGAARSLDANHPHVASTRSPSVPPSIVSPLPAEGLEVKFDARRALLRARCNSSTSVH